MWRCKSNLANGASRRPRSASRKIVVDHEAAGRGCVAGDAGAVATFGQISVSGQPPFRPPTSASSPASSGRPLRSRRGRGLASRLDRDRPHLVGRGDAKPRDEARGIDLAVKLEPAPMRDRLRRVGLRHGRGARAPKLAGSRNFFNPEGALDGARGGRNAGTTRAVSLRPNNWLRRDQVLNAKRC